MVHSAVPELTIDILIRETWPEDIKTRLWWRCVVFKVNLLAGKEMVVYAGILPYLSTLENPVDICINIITFYNALYARDPNDTTAASHIPSLANPYNVSSEQVSRAYTVLLKRS